MLVATINTSLSTTSSKAPVKTGRASSFDAAKTVFLIKSRKILSRIVKLVSPTNGYSTGNSSAGKLNKLNCADNEINLTVLSSLLV